MDLDLDPVRGFCPGDVSSFGDLVEKLGNVGFQASELYKGAKIVYRMVKDPDTTLFLGFTSNIISSGLRELIAYMVRERWVDAIVTTVGGIEEDAMKALGDFYVGCWDVDDRELRERGINRIGNILVPTERYVALEKFLLPIFEELYARFRETGHLPSPSEIARKIGERLKDRNSFLYWAARNGVPVFCPAPTDGALGLQFFFFKENGHRDLGIDVTGDSKLLADIVYSAKRTGALIIGGGVPKHHIIGANIVRGGLDYAVYITTAVEWDGSLSGARPREAVSWGKIKGEARTAYIYGDATIILPLIVLAVSE
ncbi:TPA: deoxyhypusine synthase, partial [Candidatus Micrarchaeota archaeon]|nr:deoxyhypusine synthase [Candidatus Micrarchaeota archaeon]